MAYCLQNKRLGFKTTILVYAYLIMMALTIMFVYLGDIILSPVWLLAIAVMVASAALGILMKARLLASVPREIIVEQAKIIIKFVKNGREENIEWTDMIEVGVRKTGFYYLVAIFLKDKHALWLYRVKKKVALPLVEEFKAHGIKII